MSNDQNSEGTHPDALDEEKNGMSQWFPLFSVSDNGMENDQLP